jgi:hypothetical protein
MLSGVNGEAPIASAKYSIAAGTNDISALGDLGSIAGLANLNVPQAKAPMSFSLGAGTVA